MTGAPRHDDPPEPPEASPASAIAASTCCTALHSALEATLIVDAGGTVRLASRSVGRVLGWRPEELVGCPLTLLEARGDVPRPDGEDPTECFRTGGIHPLLARHRDGSRLPVQVAATRFHDGRGEAMCCVVLHDVSDRTRRDRIAEDERQRLEQLVRERTRELERSHQQLRLADRLAAIGTLGAGLGHDMQNVLLPVRAHLNALRQGSLGAAEREHVEAIGGSVAYLQQLADSLHHLAMDPARESGAARTDLAAWWACCGALLSTAVPGHVRVTASIARGLPAVGVQEHQLTQAVLNLIVNAGEAIPARKTREGLVRVWAEAERGTGRVRLGVTDNGAGMGEAVRRRAFEMFFTTKSRGLGTGLGLSLVHRVVEQAGGEAEIESAPGKGTTVLMILPAAGGWDERAEVAEGATRAVVSVGDARARMLVRQLLHGAGAEVRETEDADGAALWVLEPSAERLSAAAAWKAGRPGRRLVLLGAPPEEDAAAWEALGADIVGDPGDLGAARAALGAGIAAVRAEGEG